MTPPVFVLQPDELATAQLGDLVRVTGDEGRHAVTVRRMAAGEEIALVDAQGRRVRGHVSAIVDRQTLDVEVMAVHDEPLPQPRITVVQALAKGDRGELAVELLTEVGVDEIVPWSAEHSVVHWRGDRAERSARKWADAMVAAAKQARRSRFPVLRPLAGTAEVCTRIREADCALVLHEDAVPPIGATVLPASGDVIVVVGPEGGISAAERAEFARAGAQEVRLGPTVLRTSSAGMAALAVLLAATPRWANEGVEG